MAATFPPESAWKTVAQKHKLKDNGLLKALATYEKLGEDKPDERVKALDTAKKLAGNLAGVKEVAANAEASKFLDQLKAAAEATKKLVADAAAKAGAAEKKPDFSKVKALAGGIGRLAALSKAERGGVDAAKDGGASLCLSEYGEVARDAVLVAGSATALTIACGATYATFGAAAATIGLAIAALAKSLDSFIDSSGKLDACLKRHDNAEQRVVAARVRQARELRGHLIREKERLGR